MDAGFLVHANRAAERDREEIALLKKRAARAERAILDNQPRTAIAALHGHYDADL